MSEASELPQQSAKSAEAHPLDSLTGGAFSAPTSGERAARLRDWLATQPSEAQLQEVFKEMSVRDKGAARAVRERMDEITRMQRQEVIAVEWAAKAQALLDAATLRVADATGWQRDAARAGAPLSREPLASLKARLAERVKTIEDLQHRVQVQREAAVLLAQRIEVLSTKPWRDAEQVRDSLGGDVAHWQEQASTLTADPGWASVEERFPPLLESSRSQLQVVWDAFQAALAATQAAAQDEQAPLPTVPVWADEIRIARGLPPESIPAATGAVSKARAEPRAETTAEAISAAARADSRADAVQKQQAAATAIEPALKVLADAPPQARQSAIAKLRGVLKQHGRWVDEALSQRIHEQLVAAGDAVGWQPAKVDTLRAELVAKAESLLIPVEGQPPAGRKLQESLRQLREQWKQTDQGMPPNHGLWKKFDEACNAAHQHVQAWLDRVHGEASQHKAARLALIEEVKAWAAAQPPVTADSPPDWKAAAQALRQFGNRWRDGGHIADKAFAELQSAWKQAISAAEAPLRTAQKASIERRQGLITEAEQLAAAPTLRVDAVKALQQRWQNEAQAVPLERKHEQKLWDAFRKPLDEAFNRKGAARSAAAVAEQQLSAHDRAVLDAAQALQVASASGDAHAIRTAMTALEAALRQQPVTSTAASAPTSAPAPAGHDGQGQPSAPATAAAEAAAPPAEMPAAQSQAEATITTTAEAAPVRPAVTARAVVAVRGDDRPGAKKVTPEVANRPARGAAAGHAAARGGARGDARPVRTPRLGDAAFRAQRDAMEQAQQALRKLAAQAHGEALGKLVEAWASRSAEALPSAQELGGKLPAAARAAWVQALSAPAQGAAAPVEEALLRLEIAADVPTPAEHLAARRMLQLQLLTRRNAPAPQESWPHDVATVLAAAHGEAQARRLHNALKPLLRK